VGVSSAQSMGEGGPADLARGGVVERGPGDHRARAAEPGRGQAVR
jgi:hypothetical protein